MSRSSKLRRFSLVALGLFAASCSNTAEDQSSAGRLIGSITRANGDPVSNAKVTVRSVDGSINAESGVTVISDPEGAFQVRLFAFNFLEREADGEVMVFPPDGSALPDTLVTGVILRTGPSEPTAEVDIVYE